MPRILKFMLQSLTCQPEELSTMDPMSITMHDVIRLVQKEQNEARRLAVAERMAKECACSMKPSLFGAHTIFIVRP